MPVGVGGGDRRQAGGQVLAAVRVDDAVGEQFTGRQSSPMRGLARRSLGVHAAVRPLARGGARARRRRRRADHQPLPLRPGPAPPRATRCASASTGAATRRAPGSRLRLPLKAPSTCPACARLRGAAPRRRRRPLAVADLPAARPLPVGRPRGSRGSSRSTTRCPSRGQSREHGAPAAVPARASTRSSSTPRTAPRRLRDEVGLDPGRIHVIPHGPFDYLTELPDEKPLPAELAARRGAGDPLLRPAPSLQGDRRPARGVRRLDRAGAELWIAGMPRMPIEPLRGAGRAGAGDGPLRCRASSPTPRSRR